MIRRFRSGAVLVALAVTAAACGPGAPTAVRAQTFTRADTLRGANGPARSWWDVTFYDLDVRVDPEARTLQGRTTITYRVLAPGRELQIDLQPPLALDSVVQEGRRLQVRHEGAAHFARPLEPQRPGETHAVTAYYGGTPVEAANPPWDGGLIWARDDSGAPWIATANQAIGASVWWPTKDLMADEPDSQRVAITVPEPLVNVSNGRLRSVRPNGDGTTTWEWFVSAPINNYGIAINAGRYAHWSEVYQGERGLLTLDFWPLAEHLEAARRQWRQVRPMLDCFESWFGPFPWYEDGFKIVETPHLGMEHQSAVAYGNGFRDGYRAGRQWIDLSGTGRGADWDLIVVHESAHEWFANNITARDVADLWVHESFAAYAENLFVECHTGSPEAGAEYVTGTRARILNDRPIQGVHGVNHEGSGDMYYKGANMLHTLRQLVDDDDRWRGVLRGLNETFARRTVDGADVEAYLSRATGIDLTEFFEQYLRTTDVPTLEVRRQGDTLRYRWTRVVPGFDMPVRVRLDEGDWTWIQPTEAWQTAAVAPGVTFAVDDDFYVEVSGG
ncbi:MAG: M1 family peptidase [Gemmatimonadetes bacterium]|nr:MAG: M1 family peptidase [Gemmatimonadota bacterium]